MIARKRAVTYFGHPDASSVEISLLTRDHVEREIEEAMKCGDRESGLQVVVGTKGSGKTELRRRIGASHEGLVLMLDADHAYLSIDASANHESSGRLKTAVSLILLREFAERVSRDGASGAATALRKALTASTKVLENVPNAVSVKAGGVSVSLKELLSRSAGEVVQVAVDELLAKVTKALQGQKGLILIDDVEDVFPGIQENPLFFEGIARSLRDINDAGKGHLHALVFVKAGLWRSWFENQREYDKVKHNIGFIEWNSESLVRLISRRIATRHDLNNDLSDETLWAKEFLWTGSFAEFSNGITRYSVNGPRDTIDLCNRAAHSAGDGLITQAHFDASIGAYSKEKLYGLNGDFADNFDGVAIFVQRVLRQAPARMTAGALAERVDELAKVAPEAERDSYASEQWFRDSTRERLALLLFEIGVVGYTQNGAHVYSIESPNLSLAEFRAQHDLNVHPAFCAELGVQA